MPLLLASGSVLAKRTTVSATEPLEIQSLPPFTTYSSGSLSPSSTPTGSAVVSIAGTSLPAPASRGRTHRPPRRRPGGRGTPLSVPRRRTRRACCTPGEIWAATMVPRPPLPRYFLERHGVGVVVQSRAAVLLRDGHPHQPQFGHLVDKGRGEFVGLVDFGRPWHDLLVDELRDHFPDLTLFLRRREIHAARIAPRLLTVCL